MTLFDRVFNGNDYNYQRTVVAIDQAIAEGAEVVFTTAPLLSRDTLKAAVKHPKIRFYNCSVDQPYSSIRTYYGRMYEAKFLTGAIAGAMANNDRIGYVGSSPIYGVPASINAFALGAQMTNPRARIDLRWSCLPGDPVREFIEKKETEAQLNAGASRSSSRKKPENRSNEGNPA